MFKHFVTTDLVVQNEPQLLDYYASNQDSYDTIIDEAEDELMTDLVNMNYDLTKMCKKLELLNETDICELGATYDGAWSDIDYARRFRMMLVLSGMNTISEGNEYNITIMIQGTNNEDDSAVSSDEIFTVKEIIYAPEPADGEYTYTLKALYRRYRVLVTSIANDDDAIDLEVYLVENIYTELMKNKVRAKIYLALKNTDYDQWAVKHSYYDEQYKNLLKNANFYVDEDDSGQIDESETDSPTDNIIISV